MIIQINYFYQKNGSPILVGIEDNFAIVSSEISGFQGKIKNYFNLQDGDIISIAFENGKVSFPKNYLTQQDKIEEIIHDESPSTFSPLDIKRN